MLRRVRKVVCSFPRTADPVVFDELYKKGEIDLELVTQGTLAERIRAAGAGLPSIWKRSIECLQADFSAGSIGSMLADLPSLKRTDYPVVADYAYARLKSSILDGHLQPGARLREAELASLLGISRTPLRQALARLELEGLLEVLPRAGLVVSSLDDQAVLELYSTRELLEGAAAAMAAENATQADIDRLAGVLEQGETFPTDPNELRRLNRSFHDALYDASHNRFLIKSLQGLHDALALLGQTTLTAPGRPEAAHEEHRAIVAAIARGDAAAAEAAARAHVRNGLPLRKRMRMKQDF